MAARLSATPCSSLRLSRTSSSLPPVCSSVSEPKSSFVIKQLSRPLSSVQINSKSSKLELSISFQIQPCGSREFLVLASQLFCPFVPLGYASNNNNQFAKLLAKALHIFTWRLYL